MNKDIQELHRIGILKILLKDKTTGNNIIWATDYYSEMGEDYEKEREIKTDLITGKYKPVILTRNNKEKEMQSARTKQHAEVFTPVWVCNKMNNYIDEAWFGRANVFNDGNKPTEKIDFPEGKNWKDYVDLRHLEITCGEAPFLVSRYDSASGLYIEVPERIGILDRKLRIVSENTDTEEEWIKWAVRAFESTYGYEFQGDNVLIARINLLKTFEDYLKFHWNRDATPKELKRIANIITWNIWQMDGLTGMPPYKAKIKYEIQINAFKSEIDNVEEYSKNTLESCFIYNWRSKKKESFNNIRDLK